MYTIVIYVVQVTLRTVSSKEYSDVTLMAFEVYRRVKEIPENSILYVYLLFYYL